MKILAVGGKVDEKSGKSSGYMSWLFEFIKARLSPKDLESFTGVNGATYEGLRQISTIADKYDVVLWFADVNNSLPKLLPKIKEVNPKCILVSSKNNIDEKYSFHHLIARSLKNKSNLFLEFKKNDEEKYTASIFDPLGNAFILNCDNIEIVANRLVDRLEQLIKFSRVSSINVGDKINIPDNEYIINFISMAKNYATKFHELVHSENQDRYLGNLSFRCEYGFPSFKYNNIMFISKRNIDKRDINVNDGFVAVSLDNTKVVEYFGENKPSVDSPIQVNLYNMYPNVRFMLHSHTYIQWAPFTRKIVPCGALEEVDEIVNIFPQLSIDNFIINLRGHGSLVLGKDVEFFKNINYIARPTPEYQLYFERMS